MLLSTIRSHRALSAIRSTRRAAFTLLEVLIVVAILVILASAASVALFRYLEDAKVGRAKTDMRAIEKALQAYYLQNDTYPSQDQIQVLSPFLDQGSEGLMDPWKRPYSFEIMAGEDTGSIDGGVKQRVVVWCQGRWQVNLQHSRPAIGR